MSQRCEARGSTRFIDRPITQLLSYLVRRMPWILPSTDYRKNVATEEHFAVADSTILKFTPKRFLEWVAIEDAEARVCASRETAVVLIKGHGQQLLVFKAPRLFLQIFGGLQLRRSLRGGHRARHDRWARPCCGNVGGEIARGSSSWLEG